VDGPQQLGRRRGVSSRDPNLQEPPMSADPHAIRTAEALRELVGETKPGIDLKVGDDLDEFAIDFIAHAPFLVLSTSDAAGNLDASPKGDAPGFVAVEDAKTLLIPDRPGNKLVYGHLNILENPKVGVIFMIPGTSETLRINGTAELTSDPEVLAKLTARERLPVLAIRVRVDECFFHCAKAFIRSGLWKPETWGEKYKVSLGAVYAKKFGAGADAARSIDEAVEEDYRERL
jgi:PPOX class probable FMN-dependent enzyme